MAEREKTIKYEPRKYGSKTIENSLSTLRNDVFYIRGCKFMLQSLVFSGGLPENTDIEGLVQEGFLSVFKSACKNKKRRGITLKVNSELPRNQQSATEALKPYLQKAILNQGLQERRRLKRSGEKSAVVLGALDDDHDYGITGDGYDTHSGKFHELPRQDRRRIYENVMASQNAIVEEASLHERLNRLGRRKNLEALYNLSGLSRLQTPDLSHWVNTLEIVGVLTDLYFINPNPTLKTVQEIWMSEKYIKALMNEWNEDAMRTTMRRKESTSVSPKESVYRYRARKWLADHVGKDYLAEKLKANTSETHAEAFMAFIEPQIKT